MSNNMPDGVTHAMSNIIAQHPFFASYLFSQMKLTYDPTCPTASTDGKTITVGDWFCGLPIRERVFVLAHEIMHGVLNHMQRGALYEQRGFGMDLKPYSPKRANIAMDRVINSILLNSGVGTMPDKGVKPESGDYLKTWDEVYLELQTPDEETDGPVGGYKGKEKKDKGNKEPEGFDQHVKPPAPQTPEEASAQKQALVQAANAAQQAGKLPSALQRIVQEVVEPKRDWKRVLRDFITSCSGKDEVSWRRLSRRRLALPPHIPFPGRDGFTIDQIVLAVDTSGSILNQVLGQFMAEIRSILEDVRPRETHLMFWDTTAVHREIEEPEDLDEPNNQPTGGGGTVYDCVIDKINELGLDPTVVVCLTDGYIECSHSDVPYNHLTITTGRDMPFGANTNLE